MPDGTTPNLADTARALIAAVVEFDIQCADDNGTDVDDAWGLLYRVRDDLRVALGMPRIIKNTALYTESPEVTDNWHCTSCGNRTTFVGIDIHGYGGPDECDSEDCGDVCECETILTQTFDVDPEDPENINYHEFLGGGHDAEIGNYTQIDCAMCGQTLWEEPKALVTATV